MNDVTELISAFIAIAKDPKAWEKRIDDMREAAGNLREVRKLKADADAAAAAAAKDLETARYERGQAEHARRSTEQQASANAQREKDLAARETMISSREKAHEQSVATEKSSFEAREADLTAREAIAAKKLNDAQKLMASYDEAKHKAALKLAS